MMILFLRVKQVNNSGGARGVGFLHCVVAHWVSLSTTLPHSTPWSPQHHKTTRQQYKQYNQQDSGAVDNVGGRDPVVGRQ